MGNSVLDSRNWVVYDVHLQNKLFTWLGCFYGSFVHLVYVLWAGLGLGIVYARVQSFIMINILRANVNILCVSLV